MILNLGYLIVVFILVCIAVWRDGLREEEDVPLSILIMWAILWPISIVVVIVFGFFSGLHQMAQTRAEQKRAARSTNSNRS